MHQQVTGAVKIGNIKTSFKSRRNPHAKLHKHCRLTFELHQHCLFLKIGLRLIRFYSRIMSHLNQLNSSGISSTATL